jgi:TPP-dependent indolepyruvate ferredoxin oxidoreductase alpha subunit
VRARIAAAGRPASDPRCAGCPQLGTFRALRRVGLEVQGGLGCDPASAATFAPAAGRWAAICGVSQVLRRGAPALLADAARAGARTLVVADGAPHGREPLVEMRLAAAGARVLVIDPADLARAEAAAAQAMAEGPGTAVVALAPCIRGATHAPPLVVAPSRCNRCGACLALACPAISDLGGESMVIDPVTCAGCRLCAPLCRGRAIGG